MGVQFLIDGAIHFGWIQISTDSTNKIYQNVYIKAYAYEATPGAPVIAGMLPGCFPPISLETAAITSTTAKLKWAGMDSVDHFELQYRMIGAPEWTTKIVEGMKSFRKVVGLNCDSNYEWRIRTICDGGEISVYSDIQTFTTTSCRLGEVMENDEETVSIFSHEKNIEINFLKQPEMLVHCSVFDMLGNLVLTEELNEIENNINSDLPPGIYIVHLFYYKTSYAVQISIQ